MTKTDKDGAQRGDAGAASDDSGESGVAGDRAKEVADRMVETRHEIRLPDGTLSYTARAGTMVLRDDAGKPRASVFSIEYVADPSDADPVDRPVTFFFNGGPGSAALWLEVGAFGPRRVDVPDVAPAPPPYRLVDNEHTLLAVTDMVFVDPVRTGYSRPEGDAKDIDFLGVSQDLDSLAEFIRLWVTRRKRWASPKLMAGESYGSMRSAGLMGLLHDRGMAFNGVILLSTVLELSHLLFEPHQDLPAVLFLPTYAATAWYHDALPEKPPALGPLLDEVRAFARGAYAAALMQGVRLPDSEADAIADQLSRYTGLSVAFIRRGRLRIDPQKFCKELLRARGRTVGRLDSRLLGRDVDDTGAVVEHDPSYTSILSPFTAAVQDHIRRELGFEDDRPYEALNLKANEAWSWAVKQRIGAPSTVAALRQAMLHNPHLRVFVANGYYDLATPFLAVEHTFDHLAVSAEDLDRVQMAYYEAGHMMYLHPPSRDQLARDLRAFYAAAIPRVS